MFWLGIPPVNIYSAKQGNSKRTHSSGGSLNCGTLIRHSPLLDLKSQQYYICFERGRDPWTIPVGLTKLIASSKHLWTQKSMLKQLSCTIWLLWRLDFLNYLILKYSDSSCRKQILVIIAQSASPRNLAKRAGCSNKSTTGNAVPSLYSRVLMGPSFLGFRPLDCLTAFLWNFDKPYVLSLCRTASAPLIRQLKGQACII